MSRYTEQEEEVKFSEPILAQKGVRMGIQFVEKDTWEVKEKEKWIEDGRLAMEEFLGKRYDACKITLQISDDSVRTEHEDTIPKMVIEDKFNIEAYPYPDKKTGKVTWLGRQALYQLEEVFGFEPVFVANGNQVDPFVPPPHSKLHQ